MPPNTMKCSMKCFLPNRLSQVWPWWLDSELPGFRTVVLFGPFAIHSVNDRGQVKGYSRLYTHRHTLENPWDSIPLSSMSRRQDDKSSIRITHRASWYVVRDAFSQCSYVCFNSAFGRVTDRKYTIIPGKWRWDNDKITIIQGVVTVAGRICPFYHEIIWSDYIGNFFNTTLFEKWHASKSVTKQFSLLSSFQNSKHQKNNALK